jgi:hypothetical protein
MRPVALNRKNALFDAYADAFQIIHKNLTEALKAANITGPDGGTYNR